MTRRHALICIPLLILTACGSQTAGKTPSAATATMTPRPTFTATPPPTATPTATMTPAPTSTPTATPEPTLTPTPEVEVTPTLYDVASGDTLGGIADAYGVTIEALMEANGISNASLISVGQELVIPVATPEG
jgi:LysM repeat protein